MGIDVMIVGRAEAIASGPGEEFIEWLEDRFIDYDVRHGYVSLEESDVVRLRELPRDQVKVMVLRQVDAMKARNEPPPYAVELMISA